MVPMFSAVVTDTWSVSSLTLAPPDTYLAVIDPGLSDDLALSVLDVVDGVRLATFQPSLASQLAIENAEMITSADLHARVDAAGLEFNGADHLFYLPGSTPLRVEEPTSSTSTRRLTATDEAAFAEFFASAPEDDLDEAFVELDHWLAFGVFHDGRLAAVASAYPWRGTRLADVGVITLPAYRGQGLGRRVVRVIAAEALRRGYEPQYRCQLDNLASVALAESAGFRKFGLWDVVTA